MPYSLFDVTDVLMAHALTGFSVDVNGGTPTDGFMVGGEVPSLILRKDGPFARRVDEWLESHWALFDQPGYFAGVWTDSDAGAVYLDISRNVADLYTALAIAESRGELAVWDVASGNEVRTEVEPARL